ncbi:transaldolase [Brachybacterium saurashtrense]|uniref:Transaldolase n=1 Tax=Brachybacterium saurashtrense TaxID=556288 RepID=A0A345YMA6_9MICO|nr:transaldolase [Brachybacterium saurashtrense]AXK45058.1 transaldolase [Brachybacterium saurashtrense]RRR21742.1 transaldolase [Brachybacterium saurashtrense]
MAQNANTQALSDAGVSIWLDDLSRERMDSGSLKELIDTCNVVGVTTNPSIFQAAISGRSEYDEDIARLAGEGTDVDAIVEMLTTDDVRRAADLLADVHAGSHGYDGRVSIEVDPRLAHETEKTIAQAEHLFEVVGRENVMIKIPATLEGLPAITAVIAAGISVNVTLIFSVERYEAVIDAYLAGLEKAAAAGKDLSTIHSVASFFVSRVDSEIDSRLESLGGEDASALRGQAGVANAQVAFGAYLEAFSGERFEALKAQGANVQRALWASTGVKNPEYSDTLYVDHLVADPSVNTMPEKTLEAAADHSAPKASLNAEIATSAQSVLERVEGAGVDLVDVFAVLEREGVEKFEKAWNELLETVSASVESARA